MLIVVNHYCLSSQASFLSFVFFRFSQNAQKKTFIHSNFAYLIYNIIIVIIILVICVFCKNKKDKKDEDVLDALSKIVLLKDLTDFLILSAC